MCVGATVPPCSIAVTISDEEAHNLSWSNGDVCVCGYSSLGLASMVSESVMLLGFAVSIETSV